MPDMKLTSKQKEVVKRLQKGSLLNSGWGTFWWSNSHGLISVNANTCNALIRLGIIDKTCKLTTLGNTINID